MKTRTFGSDGCHEKDVFADKVSLFRFQMASTEWHSRHECSGSCVGLGATVVMWGRSAAARVIFKFFERQLSKLDHPYILPVRPPQPDVVPTCASASLTRTPTSTPTTPIKQIVRSEAQPRSSSISRIQWSDVCCRLHLEGGSREGCITSKKM